MTRRRRLFEAWHKPAGWGLIASGAATILLGLDLVDAPAWILGLAALMMAALGLALLDSHLRGRWVETHEALWGPQPFREALAATAQPEIADARRPVG